MSSFAGWVLVQPAFWLRRVAPRRPPNQLAPPSRPAAGAKQADPQAEWDALVAAAKQEGKVVVETPVGTGYRDAIQVFATTYPGIEPEHQPFPDGATFIPRLDQERKAGIYSFDVCATTPIPTLQSVKPMGALDRSAALSTPKCSMTKRGLAGSKAAGPIQRSRTSSVIWPT